MMSEIFLFSSFVLNAASAIPANNLGLRPNVIPFELEVPIGSEPEQKFHIIGINPIELESINQYEKQIEQKKRELSHPKFKDQVWLDSIPFDDQAYPEFRKKDDEEMIYEPTFDEYPEISFRKTPSFDLNLYKKLQPQKKDRNGMQEKEIWNENINQLYRARKLRSNQQ